MPLLIKDNVLHNKKVENFPVFTGQENCFFDQPCNLKFVDILAWASVSSKLRSSQDDGAPNTSLHSFLTHHELLKQLRNSGIKYNLVLCCCKKTN